MCPCNIFWCTNDILPTLCLKGYRAREIYRQSDDHPKAGKSQTIQRPAEERKELSLAHLSGRDRKPVAMDAAEEGLSTAT